MPVKLHTIIMTTPNQSPAIILLFLTAIIQIPAIHTEKQHQMHNRSNSILKNFEHLQDQDLSSPASSTLQMPPTTSGCGSCKTREEIKNRNLEVIKGEVLQKLGLKLAPNITGKVLPTVSDQIWAMFQDLQDSGMVSDQPVQFKTGFSVTEEDDDYHLKMQKVLTFAKPYPRLRHSWRGHEILHFTFTDTLTKFHVSNATLYLYVKGAAERRPPADVLIEIFKVYKEPDHPDAPGLHRVYSRKVAQPSGRGDFVKIDFSETVSEWFKNPRENYGFVVNGTVNGKKVVVTDVTVDNGSKTPFVDISTVESRRRTRRSLGLNCDDKMNQNLCCRYPLVVDFEKFGWDFIIAPKRYDAHYCTGECPYLTLQKHAHTHLKQIASPNSAQPCCAPRKMSAISMLYFDENLNVVYGSLPGMVVDRCGCS